MEEITKDNEYENIKSMIMEILLENTSSSAVNLWFSDIKLILIDDNEAVFVTPTDLKKKIISQRFTDQLKCALGQIIGFEVIEHLSVHPIANINQTEL